MKNWISTHTRGARYVKWMCATQSNIHTVRILNLNWGTDSMRTDVTSFLWTITEATFIWISFSFLVCRLGLVRFWCVFLLNHIHNSYSRRRKKNCKHFLLFCNFSSKIRKCGFCFCENDQNQQFEKQKRVVSNKFVYSLINVMEYLIFYACEWVRAQMCVFL